MSLTRKAVLVIFIVLVVDQVSKVIVKTNMTLGQSIPVLGEWFIIRFIENPGMAFGIDIPGKFGKLILTLFRIAAVIAIGFYLRDIIQKKAPTAVVICLSLILAGALGNIIDSAIYGVIFSDSTYMQVAEFLPEEGGYAKALYGQVVDMLYFPVIEGTYPDWLPLKGGQTFIFFRPIFNVADSAISVGVIIILIFQRKFFKDL